MHLVSTNLVRSARKLPETPIVFIVDSDAATCRALERMIRSAGWQARTDNSAEEFLARPPASAPHCLMVEQDLPGLSGLELQRMLCNRSEMPIIFMGGHVDVQSTVRAMKAGAFEFLMKPLASNVAQESIASAIDYSRTAIIHAAGMRSLHERYESLSRREREVLSLLVCGRLNKQVGGELGISEITVKAHRGKMMRKMQARSFAELMNMAWSLRRGPLVRSGDFDAPFRAVAS